MNARWLIIDGYSLLHRDPELAHLLQRDLMMARQRLIRKIEPVADRFADKTTLVFDGRSGGPGDSFDSTLLNVLFSPADQTADTVIERLVCGQAEPSAVLVVTSDRSEQETVTGAGARVFSCAQFLDLCREKKNQLASHPASRKPPATTLGDFFPGSG